YVTTESDFCSPVIRGADTGVSFSPLLGRAGQDAWSRPVANQLGAAVFGNAAGDFLVRAYDPAKPRASATGVEATVSGDTVLLDAGATTTWTNFRFDRLTTAGAEAVATILAEGDIDAALSPFAQRCPEVSFDTLSPATTGSRVIERPDDEGISF